MCRKVHYGKAGWDKTLCGLVIHRFLPLTDDPNKVTCSRCYNSRYLDSALGNMTHTGT
jgi:hypothetical protein